jgi:hypothetical protein
MDRTADSERDVIAAIVTLHKSGLLEFEAKCGGAQVDLTIIVDEFEDDKGSFAPYLRLSQAVPDESDSSSGDHVGEDFPIDSATYELFTKGLPGLYEK